MNGTFVIELVSVDLRSGLIEVGVESFLRPKLGTDRSPLEELVGDRITTENTMFYVCGWQGTVDGALDYLVPKGFVTERNKRKDGTYDVKFESYG